MRAIRTGYAGDTGRKSENASDSQKLASTTANVAAAGQCYSMMCQEIESNQPGISDRCRLGCSLL